MAYSANRFHPPKNRPAHTHADDLGVVGRHLSGHWLPEDLVLVLDLDLGQDLLQRRPLHMARRQWRLGRRRRAERLDLDLWPGRGRRCRGCAAAAAAAGLEARR
eukprot:363244-Chlamydomonas_euryale.AAC.1